MSCQKHYICEASVIQYQVCVSEATEQVYNLLIPCAHWLVRGWGFWLCKVSKLGWWWDGPSSYKRCSNTLRALVSAHAGAVRPQNCPICLPSRLLCWSAIIGGTNPNHCCATNSGQFGHLDLYEIANHEHLSVADFPAVCWDIHHGTQSAINHIFRLGCQGSNITFCRTQDIHCDTPCCDLYLSYQ